MLVAEHQEDLATEQRLIWDSGKVVSDLSINIPYTGTALSSDTRYYWKVRLWDKDGIPTPYSEPALWRMGLLHQSEWSGKWISLAKDATDGLEPPDGEHWKNTPMMHMSRAPYVRKEFELASPVREATLYATARGVYQLWLNGSRIGDAELAPGWTNYHTDIHYQTYDVTAQLTNRANALAGIIGDGWYTGFVGFDAKHSRAHYGTDPQLLLQLHIQCEDGTTQKIVSDTSWKSATGPIIYSDLLMGEFYDARLEWGEWSTPGFDGTRWSEVHVTELTDTRLVAQPDQPIRVTREIATQKVTNPAPGIYIFDLGQNMVGWTRLKVSGPAGTRIILRHAEMLNPDGTIYTENLRSARATDTYILKGEGQEIFEPHFTFHGFRYVEITGHPGEPTTETITGRVVHSDTPTTGTFSCSNPMVNQLQSNIVWGQ